MTDQNLDHENAKTQLRALIERIEDQEREKRDISENITSIYQEAKGSGFDVKALRTVIRLRRMDKAEREELESIVELYRNSIGL